MLLASAVCLLPHPPSLSYLGSAGGTSGQSARADRVEIGATAADGVVATVSISPFCLFAAVCVLLLLSASCCATIGLVGADARQHSNHMNNEHPSRPFATVLLLGIAVFRLTAPGVLLPDANGSVPLVSPFRRLLGKCEVAFLLVSPSLPAATVRNSGPRARPSGYKSPLVTPGWICS